MGSRALAQANGLEDRYVEFPEGGANGIAALGSADDEILQHDQRRRPGRGDQFGQTFERLARGAAPAGEHLHAGLALFFNGLTERGRGAALHVRKVEDDDGGRGFQAKLAGLPPGCGVAQLVLADAQAQRSFRPRRGERPFGLEQMGEQGLRVVDTAGLPKAPGGQPVAGRGVCFGSGQGIGGWGFQCQLAQRFGREAGQTAGRIAAHQVEAGFAVHRQHRRLRPGVARQHVFETACRIAEH